MPLVVGAPRSGTTLLRFMLDAHPEVAIPPETGFLDIFGRFNPRSPTLRREFFDAVTSYPPGEMPVWENFKIPREQYWEQLQQINPFTVEEGYRLFYKMYAARFGKKRWGEKTPLYCLYMTEIERMLPEAHFIHLIRDGRDVALSLKSLACSPGDSIETRAEYWKKCVTATRRQGAHCRRYMEVRYEDMLSDSAGMLGKICAFIHLKYDPEMLNYPRHIPERLSELTDRRKADGSLIDPLGDITKDPLLLSPQISHVGKWKTAMPREDQVRFEQVAGDLLRELDYETLNS